MPVREIDITDTKPSLALAREWGYDDNLEFFDASEDLILGDLPYVPVLMELANDPRCPKQKQALAILFEFTENVFALRRETEAAQLAAAIQNAPKPSASGLVEWISYFERLHKQLTFPERLSEAAAQTLALDLLTVSRRTLELECTGGMASSFAEYHAFSNNFHLFLYVDRERGIWIPPTTRRQALEVDLPFKIIKISGRPAYLQDIAKLESELGSNLPESYKQFLLTHDGGGVDYHYQYYPIPNHPGAVHVTDFWSTGQLPHSCFSLLHQLGLAISRSPDWPKWLLPIGASGTDAVAISISGPRKGAVFLTGKTIKDLYEIATSFDQFFSSLTNLQACGERSRAMQRPAEGGS